MKIALINLEEEYGCLPLGLATLAGYIRKYGNFNNIRVIDREDPIKAIKEYQPELISIAAVSAQYYRANKLIGEIKKISNAPLILGGTHINAMPEILPKSNFDIGVLKEGEKTFLELATILRKKGKLEPKDLRKIKGIVFVNEKKEAEITPNRELMRDLDEIPFPALDLLKMKEYYLVPGRAGSGLIGIRGYMMSSRGCPYSCVYCGSNSVWGMIGVRWQSAKKFVEHVKKWVEEYGANHIVLYDDLMIINKARLKEIGERLEKENLTKKVDFEIYGRANVVDEETVQLLKKMGVSSIAFGLESGSNRILKAIKGESASVEHGWKALRLCKMYGLKTTGLFIIGNPEETEEDIKKTQEFMHNPDLDLVQVYQCTPLPGTKLWDIAVKQKIVNKDFYESEESSRPVELNPNTIMSQNISKEKFIEWYHILKKEMNKKNDIEDKLKIDASMLKFFLSYRFYKKLWRHKKHVPRYIKQVLRIK